MESTDETIARANAALRLGDWFVPPLGSRIKLFDGEIARTGGVYRYNHGFTELRFGFHAHGALIGITYHLCPPSYFQIIKLPMRYPPFEQWERE